MNSFVAMHNQTIHRSVELVTETCCACGILFAMPAELKKRALEQRDRLSFYCPNGHSQHYVGKSDGQLLREERERADRLRGELSSTRAERDHHWTERKKLCTRHHNMRKRIQQGVCPCCNRTFENLARHMKSKHPAFDYEPEPLK
jgi:hypothetical protein